MNSLINNAEDVTILQSQETLANCLGSDENIADLFNGIAKYLAPDHQDYAKFKNAIKAHYKNKFKIWMALWLDAQFGTAWENFFFFF